MISVKKRNAYIRLDGEFHNRIHEVVLATEHDRAVAALSAEINALRAGKEFCGACGEGCESCRVLQESPDLAELAQARCEQQAKFGILAGEPEIIGERCADGGKCHHKCHDECSRRKSCVPLSGSGLANDWSVPNPSFHCHTIGHAGPGAALADAVRAHLNHCSAPETCDVCKQFARPIICDYTRIPDHTGKFFRADDAPNDAGLVDHD